MEEDENEDRLPPPRREGGCFSKLMKLGIFLSFVGIVAALYEISQPQDFSDIDGRGVAAEGKDSRDLKAVLKNATDGGYPLKLSEEEINLYLRDTLEFEQGGLLAEWVELEEVLVRLEDGRAEVIMARSVMGYPLTISMYIRVVKSELPDGGASTEIFWNGGLLQEWLPRVGRGGQFGSLPVPEGFLRVALPAFRKLGYLYYSPVPAGSRTNPKPVKELDFIIDMAQVTFTEGEMTLEPRKNLGLELPGGR
jgi:hypothetical protein